MSYTAPKHDNMCLTSHHIQSHHMTSPTGIKQDVFVVSLSAETMFSVQVYWSGWSVDQSAHIQDKAADFWIFWDLMSSDLFCLRWANRPQDLLQYQDLCGFFIKTCSAEQRDPEPTRAAPDLRTLHRPNLTNSQYFSWLDVSGVRCMNNVNDWMCGRGPDLTEALQKPPRPIGVSRSSLRRRLVTEHSMNIFMQ